MKTATTKQAADGITSIRFALKGATLSERAAIAASLRGLLALAEGKGATASPVAKRTTMPTAAEIVAAGRATVARGEGFGTDKAYISDVHAELNLAMSVAAFGVELVALHRAGELSLNRADLVEAMPAAKVAASETCYLSATFHFVRV